MLCECGCGKETTIATKTISHIGVVKGQPNHFLPGHHRSTKRHRRIDSFLTTGLATCLHHGQHNEWTVRKQIERRTNKPYDLLCCLRCERSRTKRYNTENRSYQDDYRFSVDGTISRLLAAARKRARANKLPFDIDKAWVIEQIQKQSNRCAYTGLLFDWTNPHPKQPRLHVPSIDQRCAGLGYSRENSVLVCWVINQMKWSLSLTDFVYYCQVVANAQPK